MQLSVSTIIWIPFPWIESSFWFLRPWSTITFGASFLPALEALDFCADRQSHSLLPAPFQFCLVAQTVWSLSQLWGDLITLCHSGRRFWLPRQRSQSTQVRLAVMHASFPFWIQCSQYTPPLKWFLRFGNWILWYAPLSMSLRTEAWIVLNEQLLLGRTRKLL